MGRGRERLRDALHTAPARGGAARGGCTGLLADTKGVWGPTGGGLCRKGWGWG
jgi:hypothetical protein